MTIWMPRLEGRAGPRFRAIVDALAGDVASGALPPGHRLPTHRDLADRLGVTVGTVTRAYAEAARRGLVTGEVGRGTFVRRARVGDEEGPVVDLAQNHPPEPAVPPQRTALVQSLSTLTSQPDLDRLLDYPVAGGSLADRAAGAAWVSRVGVAASPDRVVVCSGSQHGLMVVLATLLRPGDLLLTESLTYAGLKSVAGLLHLRLSGLPIDDEGLRPDAFEAACRQRRPGALYLIPTLHNPTTAIMPAGRRREIAAIAQRHGIPIVEDDVHGLLPERRPEPLAALVPDAVYYLTSTSKTLAPGLRVAYLLAPERMVPRIVESLRATTWAVAPLTATVATSWIGDGTADVILAARRREARERQLLAREILEGADFDSKPEAYYIWLRLPEPWRRDEFAAVLRARGAEVTSAAAFAVGRDPAPHAVRLCLGATRSRNRLARGLSLVAETLRSGGDARATVV
jgi:DNA-binding transcriptional MocR family regulator